MNEPTPTVDDLDDAATWIGVLYRGSVRELERLNIIEARLDVLETRWWQWRKQRRNRSYLAWLRRQAQERRP